MTTDVTVTNNQFDISNINSVYFSDSKRKNSNLRHQFGFLVDILRSEGVKYGKTNNKN